MTIDDSLGCPLVARALERFWGHAHEVDLAGKKATLGVPEGFTLPDAADQEQSVGAGGEA